MSFDQWNGYSAWILDNLARASVHGGIAAAIVWALCTLIPRLPANAKSWLWRLVFLKMVLALIWVQPIELPVLAPLDVETKTMQLPLVAVNTLPEASTEPIFKAGPASGLVFPANSAREVEVILPSPALIVEPTSPLNGESLLLLAWFGGVTICFLILARQFLHARKMHRSVAPCTNEPLIHQLIALSRATGLVRLPRLASSDTVTRPMLVGILRPTLVFPEQLLATASAESLRLMIAHELAHVRRGDLAWTALAAVVRAIFFFHPLVWLARRESLLAQEIACDELALQITSSATTCYAEMLVDVVSLPVGRAPALISLGVAENRKTLERRIRSMKFIGHKKSKVVQFITTIILLTALIALIPFRLVAAEPDIAQPVALQNLNVPENPEVKQVERVPAQINQQIDKRTTTTRNTFPIASETVLATQQARAESDDKDGQDLPADSALQVDSKIERPAPSLQRSVAALLAEIRGKDRAELRAILPTLVGDALLTKYLQDLSEAEQQYAALNSDYADKHPEVIKLRRVMKQIDSQIENRIDGILAGLEAKANVDAELNRENHPARETARSSEAVSVPREVVRVTPAGPVSVHARVGGMVEKVLVSVGEDVKKGQLLLEMDNSAARGRLNTAEARAKIAEADLRIAQAELDDSQRDYERKKRLTENGLAPESSVPNLEKIKAAIIKAEAQAELAFLERDQAKQDLDRYILRAPLDGRISFIIHEGYFVPEGGGKILAEIRTPARDHAARTQAIERLKSELAMLQEKEAELLKVYTEGAAPVQNTRKRIAVLESRLRQEDLNSNTEQ